MLWEVQDFSYFEFLLSYANYTVFRILELWFHDEKVFIDSYLMARWNTWDIFDDMKVLCMIGNFSMFMESTFFMMNSGITSMFTVIWSLISV